LSLRKGEVFCTVGGEGKKATREGKKTTDGGRDKKGKTPFFSLTEETGLYDGGKEAVVEKKGKSASDW